MAETENNTEQNSRPQPSAVTIVIWCLPVLVSLLILGLALLMGWEPWFGYASIIAGVLASIMMAGNHYGITGE